MGLLRKYERCAKLCDKTTFDLQDISSERYHSTKLSENLIWRTLKQLEIHEKRGRAAELTALCFGIKI
jgi:pyruvate-formate lyase-activating enzyme